MFFARNEGGTRIYAKNANRIDAYYCPVCDAPVVLRRGEIRAPHFAHLPDRKCTDSWTYDLSDWHLKMQEFFPEENREVVVRSNGKTHRADVLVGNTVIEMQHSPMSAEEFKERTDFFRSLDYRVVWIFDMRERKLKGTIDYLNYDSDTKFRWSHPVNTFDLLEEKISDQNENFALFFNLYDSEDEEYTNIWRVIWTPLKDLYGGYAYEWGEHAKYVPDLSRFVISDEAVVMESINDDTDEFFLPLQERQSKRAWKAVSELFAEARQKHFWAGRKFIYEKGHKQEEYTCPKTKEWGIREDECKHCKHCALIIEKKKERRPPCELYCCYPYEYQQAGEQVSIYNT